MQLLAALEALGDASVAELAALTGRTRQSIHPHLASMARVGIIARESRPGGPRKVVRFRYRPEVMSRIVDESTGYGVRIGADISARVLGDAQVRCRRWGAAADGRPIDFSRNPDARTAIRISWLDSKMRRRLNRLLKQAEELLRQGCVRRKGRRTYVLLYHFPDLTAAEARQAANSRILRRPSRRRARP